MEPMLRPITALWTRRAAVMGRKALGAWREAGWPSRAAPRWAQFLIVGWRELRHEVGDPVLHLGERHGIDDLIADTVVVLAAEVRLAPEILELDRAERLGDPLWVQALGLFHRGHEGEGRIGEVDARRVPLAVLLGVARLPVLDLFRERGLHVAVDPRALDVLLPGDARYHRGIHLADVDEPALVAEHAGLLDDQADAAGRCREDADDVRFLRQDTQQQRVEIRHDALEELPRYHLIAQRRDVLRLHLERPPSGVVVRRDGGHALDVRMVLLDPVPEGHGLRRGREAVERVRISRAHQPIGICERQVQNARLVDRFLYGLDHGSAQDGDELDAVLADEPIDRGRALGDHVLVVVGDDLKLVLLATHLEPPLAVDLVEDQLGRALVGNAPGRRRARERRRDAELDDVRGLRARTRSQQHRGEKPDQRERSRLFHRRPLLRPRDDKWRDYR